MKKFDWLISSNDVSLDNDIDFIISKFKCYDAYSVDSGHIFRKTKNEILEKKEFIEKLINKIISECIVHNKTNALVDTFLYSLDFNFLNKKAVIDYFSANKDNKSPYFTVLYKAFFTHALHIVYKNKFHNCSKNNYIASKVYFCRKSNEQQVDAKQLQLLENFVDDNWEYKKKFLSILSPTELERITQEDIKLFVSKGHTDFLNILSLLEKKSQYLDLFNERQFAIDFLYNYCTNPLLQDFNDFIEYSDNIPSISHQLTQEDKLSIFKKLFNKDDYDKEEFKSNLSYETFDALLSLLGVDLEKDFIYIKEFPNILNYNIFLLNHWLRKDAGAIYDLLIDNAKNDIFYDIDIKIPWQYLTKIIKNSVDANYYSQLIGHDIVSESVPKYFYTKKIINYGLLMKCRYKNNSIDFSDVFNDVLLSYINENILELLKDYPKIIYELNLNHFCNDVNVLSHIFANANDDFYINDIKSIIKNEQLMVNVLEKMNEKNMSFSSYLLSLLDDSIYCNIDFALLVMRQCDNKLLNIKDLPMVVQNYIEHFGVTNNYELFLKAQYEKVCLSTSLVYDEKNVIKSVKKI